VQAFRKGNNRLILFSDVDVLTWVEREIQGQQLILPYIVRAADRKTFREIHDEIRAAQLQDPSKTLGGGVKALQVLAAWLFPPVILGLELDRELDREKVSAGVEEELGNGDPLVGDVRRWGRLGHPFNDPIPLLDHGGRHRPEAGGHGRTDCRPGLPEPDGQLSITT
jgi:hypothetical protein